MRGFPEYGSGACFVERPTWEAQVEQYSDTVLMSPSEAKSGCGSSKYLGTSHLTAWAQEKLQTLGLKNTVQNCLTHHCTHWGPSLPKWERKDMSGSDSPKKRAKGA